MMNAIRKINACTWRELAVQAHIADTKLLTFRMTYEASNLPIVLIYCWIAPSWSPFLKRQHKFSNRLAFGKFTSAAAYEPTIDSTRRRKFLPVEMITILSKDVHNSILVVLLILGETETCITQCAIYGYIMLCQLYDHLFCYRYKPITANGDKPTL